MTAGYFPMCPLLSAIDYTGWFDFGTIRTKGILGEDDHGLGIVSGKNPTN